MASFPASGDDCDDEDLHAYHIIFHKYIRGFSISCHKIMAALDDIMGVRLEKKKIFNEYRQGIWFLNNSPVVLLCFDMWKSKDEQN